MEAILLGIFIGVFALMGLSFVFEWGYNHKNGLDITIKLPEKKKPPPPVYEQMLDDFEMFDMPEEEPLEQDAVPMEEYPDLANFTVTDVEVEVNIPVTIKEKR
jgi:hypothetical protein